MKVIAKCKQIRIGKQTEEVMTCDHYTSKSRNIQPFSENSLQHQTTGQVKGCRDPPSIPVQPIHKDLEGPSAGESPWCHGTHGDVNHNVGMIISVGLHPGANKCNMGLIQYPRAEAADSSPLFSRAQREPDYPDLHCLN